LIRWVQSKVEAAGDLRDGAAPDDYSYCKQGDFAGLLICSDYPMTETNRTVFHMKDFCDMQFSTGFGKTLEPESHWSDCCDRRVRV